MLRGRSSNRMGVWLLFLLMTVAPGLAGAATVELISSARGPVPDSFGTSSGPALSADGRYVAFLSNAANLVPGQVDDNDLPDVFLHDRLLGTTLLVSHAAGSPARAASRGGYDSVAISADGRYVAFSGLGANLVPGALDPNGDSDVFLWDRVTDTTTLVSHAAGSPGTAANGFSSGVRMSADGSFLVFLSRASNLVAGQAEPAPNVRTPDVFLWSRASNTATLVSRQSGTTATAANQGSLTTAISADGGVVVFTTQATDLLSNVVDVNTDADLYAWQRSTNTLSLVSRAASALNGAAGVSFGAIAVSADGRYVAFSSHSDQLAPVHVDDDPETPDAFLYDRTTGEMWLASHTVGSPARGGGIFADIALSADGRYVAFSSDAPDLVPGQVDPHQKLDVFVYDRVTDRVALASHSHGSVTTAGSPGAGTSPGISGQPSFSADGRFLAFNSLAVDLVPGQADAPDTPDVFLYDQTTRSVTLVSRTRASASAAGNRPSFSPVLSADGGVAAFLGQATDLGEGQTDPYNFQDLFLYERSSGEITHPSRRDPGLTPPLTSASPSLLGGLSADGQLVVFEHQEDVFLQDAMTDTTALLSPPPTPPYNLEISRDPALSADGRFAAFLSRQLVPGNVEGLYLYDRATGARTLVNHAPDSATSLDGFPGRFALSADGRFVAYECESCGLVPGHAASPSFFFQEIFLYDRLSGLNTLVSRAADTSQPAFPANGESHSPSISADGRYVAFRSFASNLFPGQTDNSRTEDLFVFDRVTGVTSLVTSVPGSPNTAAGLSGISYLSPAVLSADGRFIAFESGLTNLVPGQVDANAGPDVFLYDQVTRATVLVSHAASSLSTTGNRPSQTAGPEDPISMSADGRFVVFESLATDLVVGADDTNNTGDVFLYDRLTGANSLVSHAGGNPLKAGNGASETPRISADGGHVAFLSGATDLIPGQTVPAANTGSRNLYVQDRSAGTSTFIAPALRTGRPIEPSPTIDDGESLSCAPWISAGGRRVAFTSDAALVPGDYNGTWDVYLWDREGLSTVPPCRLLDTRRRAERPILTSNVPRTVTAHGRCGVPATATEVVVKVTVFNPSDKGNLRFYPGAVTASPSGILRFERGGTRTETFTLPLNPNGTLTILPFVRGRGTVHVAVEVNGYVD